MQTTPRSPLSLGPCENNTIGGYYSSSSGTAEYRYPVANTCSELASTARDAFDSLAESHRPITKWTVISACTLLSVLASTRFPSPAKFVLGAISLIFFVVVCLPKLRESAHNERTANVAVANVYTHVADLIRRIAADCSALELARRLPINTALQNRFHRFYVAPGNFEVTQELLDGLDRFIDDLMRIVHNWNALKDVWRQNNRPQQPVSDTDAGKNGFLADWVLIGSRFPLGAVVQKIEETRQLIAATLNNTEQQDRDAATEACRTALGELFDRIYALEGAMVSCRSKLRPLISPNSPMNF